MWAHHLSSAGPPVTHDTDASHGPVLAVGDKFITDVRHTPAAGRTGEGSGAGCGEGRVRRGWGGALGPIVPSLRVPCLLSLSAGHRQRRVGRRVHLTPENGSPIDRGQTALGGPAVRSVLTHARRPRRPIVGTRLAGQCQLARSARVVG